jgi:hypothetical protein
MRPLRALTAAWPRRDLRELVLLRLDQRSSSSVIPDGQSGFPPGRIQDVCPYQVVASHLGLLKSLSSTRPHAVQAYSERATG